MGNILNFWRLLFDPSAVMRSCVQSDAAHALGVCHRIHLLNRVVSWVEETEARSCDAVQVTDSTLGGIPARVFHPLGGNQLKRGIVYFHGGGWALGSARESHVSAAYGPVTSISQ